MTVEEVKAAQHAHICPTCRQIRECFTDDCSAPLHHECWTCFAAAIFDEPEFTYAPQWKPLLVTMGLGLLFWTAFIWAILR